MTTQKPLSLKDYLFEHHLTEADEETLKYAKAAYAKQYIQNYQQNIYPKEKKRFLITVSLKEYQRLQKESQKHHKKLAVFARESLFAHLNHSFLVPDEERLQSLGLALRQIGNNINQIAHHTNHLQKLTYGNAKKMRQELNDLEDEVNQAVRTPPNLLEVVAQELQKNPSLLPQLEALLLSVRSSNQEEL